MEVKASNQITLMNTDLVDAAKTATNYLGFSSDGLVVGDLTGSILGKNVLIDSDGVDIRSGNTVLASFEANKISLGVNSYYSKISLCDDNGTIYMAEYMNPYTNETYPALCLASSGLVLTATDSNNSSNRAEIYTSTANGTYDAKITLLASNSSTAATIDTQTNAIYIGMYDYNTTSELAKYMLSDNGTAYIYTTNGLTISGPVYFEDPLYIEMANGQLVDVLTLGASGYLCFGDSSKNMAIYGNTVTISPVYKTCVDSDLDVSTKIYVGVNDIEITGSNKVLWSGQMCMYASQTATLSEAISAQVNGIVLVFCAWDASSQTLQQWDWNHIYIPKQDIVYNNTTGHTMALFKNGLGSIAYKYLYISDTTIKGHDNNGVSGTANGITYNNTKFVLRYVIGV